MSWPESWARLRLGDVLHRVEQKIDPQASIDLSHYYVGLEDIESHTGRLSNKREHLTEDADILSVKTVFATGDILYGKLRPNLNKVYVAERDGICSTDIWALRASPVLLPEFGGYYLRSAFVRQLATQLATGANLPRISADSFDRIPILLPTLPEQRRIVVMLQQADAVGNYRSDTLPLTDNIATAQFVQLFGDIFRNNKSWPQISLGRASTIVRGSSPRPQGDPRYFGGPVPRLMVSDLSRDGLWVDAITDSLTEEGATMSRPMPAQSVVIAVSGAPGLAAILNHDACIHDGFVGLRDLDATLLPEFVAYSLNLLRARSDQQAVGAVFRNLTTNQVKAINIPHPPVELQARFKLFLLQGRALKSDIGTSSKLLDKLTDTIRIESFSGNLTAIWREKHENEIAEAARGRDAVLHERSLRVVRIEEHAPAERPSLPERNMRRWVLNQLSDFQGFVLTALHEFKGSLLPDDAQALDSFCSLWPMEHEIRPHDHVRRVLDQLAELGLIAKITVQNAMGDFVTAYRPLRSGEETRLQDAGRLQALIRKESTRTAVNPAKENDSNSGAGGSKP